MPTSPVINIQGLDFQWYTRDPFLFCVHHQDFYPRGNDALGPDASLAGRNLGQDFHPADGWRMYHGETVPGFPGHPHRGFETITVVQKGMVDHADSLGAAGRYGEGDVQWMTAGKGIQHSEMFPLLRRDRDNPLELFQIWLNLPASSKMVAPHFAMFWNEQIPWYKTRDDRGREISVQVVAGDLQGVAALPPPPDSWAAARQNQVAVWIINLEEGAQWTLPGAAAELNRDLYFFQGESLDLAGQGISVRHGVSLRADQPVQLSNGPARAGLLLLQGRPIREPVAHYGPFVMNTRQELQQAFYDYQRNHFGGWPWPRQDPVHDIRAGRFARYDDGTEEVPGTR